MLLHLKLKQPADTEEEGGKVKLLITPLDHAKLIVQHSLEFKTHNTKGKKKTSKREKNKEFILNFKDKSLYAFWYHIYKFDF